jgi:hypothetical protein
MTWMTKKTQNLIDNRSLEVDIEEINTYILLYRQRKAGQNQSIANRSFENVSEFKYLGTTVPNQNLMQVEIKTSQNFGNACCR